MRTRFVYGSVFVVISWVLSSSLFAQASAPSSPYKPFDSGAAYQSARARSYHVEHYKLILSLDQANRELRGVDIITLIPFRDEFRTVELDSSGLTIDNVTGGDGTPLNFRVEPDNLFVDLDRPRGSGERVQVSITYHGTPSNGLYFINPDKAYPGLAPEVWTQGESEFNHFWFPCYDYPNDRATSETIVTVPDNEVVISNGKLLSVTANDLDHTKTFHWEESVPHSTYLTSLVVGPFTKFEAAYKSIPIEYYVAPGVDKSTMDRSFGLTPDMVAFFSEITRHEYPYEKYAQSAVERYGGGMENISATTQTDQTLHDERAEQDYSSLGLVAHELAHQWFGDLLTCASWSDIWLNEGFASFFESLYREHHLGHEEYREELRQFEQQYFNEDQRYRRPIVTHYYNDDSHLFDSTTYQKGARVLDMLRHVLGDKAFFAGIQNYVAANQTKNVVTFDIEKAMEESSGQNLDWFFNEWVYHAGHPELKVSSTWDDSQKVETIHVEQTQATDATTLLFRMPVEIEIHTAGAVKTYPVWISERKQDFYFPLDGRPTMVLFDPGDHVVKKIDFQKPIDELILQARQAKEGQDRRWAALELGKVGADPAAVEALRRVLANDSFHAVRVAAAEALGSMRTPTARDALIEGGNDKSSRVREAVARALGDYGKDERVAVMLKTMLDKDDSYAAQAAAAESLAKMKAPDAFETLKKKLATHPYRSVAAGIYSAFNILGDKNAITMALEDSAYGRPDFLRFSAINTLGHLGQGNREVCNRLTEITEDPNVFMRSRAIVALGMLKDPEVLPKLEEIAARAGHGGRFGGAGVADAAAQAIEQIRAAMSSKVDTAKLQSQIDELKRSNQRLEHQVEELQKRER